MTLSFILNGDDVNLQAEAGERLVNILRDDLQLCGTKTGCFSGCCGSCLVFMNNRLTPSCMIPAFRVRGAEIVTIEGFAQTEECQDIIQGFDDAGMVACEHCRSGKILIAESLLSKNPEPLPEEILSAYSGLRCVCTETKSLVKAVLKAAERRQRRLYER
jgi:carbon-monoxide dehydrogenase small subunit